MFRDCHTYYAVENGTKRILNFRVDPSLAKEMMEFYPNAQLVVAIDRQYPDGDIKVFCGHTMQQALTAASKGKDNSQEFFG